MINKNIDSLVNYAIDCGLIENTDKIYAVNRILEILGLDSYEQPSASENKPLNEILEALCDYAVSKRIIDDNIVARDLFDTKLMGALTPFPSQVIKKFGDLYAISPEKATDYYYKLSGDTNYIRRDRIAKDMKWTYETENFGTLDITVNLSKPEKDPKAIAAARNAKKSGYPKCALCKENEGYAGHMNAAARQNHRIIPITMNGTDWGMQYSPYVYYNEHCICFNGEHTPMKIEKATFVKLFDFVKLFPHYFLGSNADLPIVGGSILSHDHFQGGRYEFAMAKASVESEIIFTGFEDIRAGIVKWPMSVIRLWAKDSDRVVMLADKILTAWRGYTDEKAFVYASTNGEYHNTITPIARMRNGNYELDLVLRNNITTDEHPLGVYHPHSELHNIKKENIGLIEVMGLAVLPSRLSKELSLLADYIISGKDIASDDRISKHADWVKSFIHNYTVTSENVETILKTEVGKTFEKVLEHAGVFKCTPEGRLAFMRFIDSI